MNSMNLNLLPSKAKFQAAKIKLQSQVKMVMIGIVGVWALLGLVILVANMAAKIKISRATNTNKKVQANYMGMQEEIVTSQRFKYKTKMIGSILKDRFEYGEAFELISKLFPEGIVVKNYELLKGGKFKIDGQMQNKENVDRFEEIIREINRGENENLSKAEMKSLALQAGVWNFIAEVDLK